MIGRFMVRARSVDGTVWLKRSEFGASYGPKSFASLMTYRQAERLIERVNEKQGQYPDVHCGLFQMRIVSV